jgi:DNA-binding GntR family transcriptional regulator
MQMTKLPKIGPLAHALYERLKADIMTARLAPEAALQEEDLARRFGASRTPVREALRMLQNDGLVAITHNRGAVVTEIPFRQIMEAFELRELLEPHAARAGAPRADLEEVSRLETMQRGLPHVPRDLEDVLAMDRADEELHELIARASGNALLAQMVRKARLLTRRLILIVPPERYPKGIGEHLAILSAYRRRDGTLAEHLVREHVRNAKNRLLGNEISVGGPIKPLVPRSRGKVAQTRVRKQRLATVQKR